MKDFIISTESNCDLPADYIKENDICVIPHYYTVDEEVFGDGRELSCKEFYDEMRNLKKVGTMASNPAVIEEKFTSYVKDGKDILHISFSSALSGGFGNVAMVSKQIMEEFTDAEIIVIDTLTASLGDESRPNEKRRQKPSGNCQSRQRAGAPRMRPLYR